MKKTKASDSGAEPWEHAKKNSKGCKLKIRGSKINRHPYNDGTKGKILKPRGKNGQYRAITKRRCCTEKLKNGRFGKSNGTWCFVFFGQLT